MKSTAARLTMALIACSAFAHANQDTNYGDPTASYSGVGLERSKDRTQVTGVYGGGEHIGSASFGMDDSGKSFDYRLRYFNVDKDSGFGWSIDGIGGRTKNDTGTLTNNAALVGLLQKFDVTDNVIVVPMLSAGKAWLDVDAQGKHKNSKDAWLVQPGVYAMYGFDAGHWIYANPKTTYNDFTKDWTHEIEMGGGYMIADNQSLGFKYEQANFQGNRESKGTINYFLYF